MIFRPCAVILSTALIMSCSDGTSGFGQRVEQELIDRKSKFESEATQADIRRFIAQSTLSGDARTIAEAALKATNQASSLVDPALAREIIDRSEIGIACAIAIAKNSNEISSLKARLLNGRSPELALEISRVFTNAKQKVTNSIVTKQMCTPGL